MLRIAFYSHDTYGLGHLRRCLKIAGAFVRHLGAVDGLILTGSPWADRFVCPPGFDFVTLPPVIKDGPGKYRPRRESPNINDLLHDRRQVISATLAKFDPHLLVVDNVPVGLAGEVHSVLKKLSDRESTRVVLALRDVIDEDEVTEREWEAWGAFDTIDRLYDEIWVFGGPDCPVARFLASRLSTSVVHCGCLGIYGRAPVPRSPFVDESNLSPDIPSILVTGGGGGDAVPLMTAYLEAVATVRPRATHRVVLGPDYPNGVELTRRDLSRLGVQIVAFDPDLTTAMAASDVVVSMAGYNTVCEALALGKRLVLVPRVWPRKEQWLRAQALAERSRAALVDPGQLTPRVLWNAVESVLAGPTPALIHPAGETRSAARAAQLLQTGAVV